MAQPFLFKRDNKPPDPLAIKNKLWAICICKEGDLYLEQEEEGEGEQEREGNLDLEQEEEGDGEQ